MLSPGRASVNQTSIRNIGRVLRNILPVALYLVASNAQACSIPVFRYALEHWVPDSYRVHVFHDAPLTAEQQSVIDSLQQRARTANAVMTPVLASSEMEPRATAVWESLNSPELPAVVVQLPGAALATPVVWAGPLSDRALERLFSSPARMEIVRELEGGVSAIWVFLESGNAERDDLLYGLLTAELERLERTLKLPPIEEADLAQLTGSPSELKIRFSSVRVSRTNPDETHLVNMLLSTEADLRDPELATEPMLFPVFGRGRALYALVGDGISSQMIEEGARFLTSACQCTVKLQNPGTDLLLTAGWETYVAPETPQPPEYVAIPNRPIVAEIGNAAAASERAIGQDLSTTAQQAIETTPAPTSSMHLDSQNAQAASNNDSPIAQVSPAPNTQVGPTGDSLSSTRNNWSAFLLCLTGIAVVSLGLIRRN